MIKELYQKSLYKWNNVLDAFKRKQPIYAQAIALDFCAFCSDVQKKTDNKIWCICTGWSCAKFCSIDKKICGDPKSLVSHLFSVPEKKTRKWIKGVKKIRKALKRHLND